jgi:hypothetical protein
VEALAAARAEARLERDFARADELKARIEAAGWKVADDGPRYSLAPARPPDRPDAGRVVYASAASVPSRLADAADPGASVVIIARELEPAVSSVAAFAEETDVDLILVVPDGSVERTALLERLADATATASVEVGGPVGERRPIEVLWVTGGLAPGIALAAALRRVGRELVVVLEAGVELDGALVAPIAAALADPAIAAVGVDGLTSADLHRFRTAGVDEPVVALGPGLVAFRRGDAGRLNAIDGRLVSLAGVIVWSSLALRERDGDRQPRRVLVVDVPIRARPSPAEVERRDRYRIAGRFGEDGERRA